MQESWSEYFKDVKTSYPQGTEYTPRTPFENLLNEIKPSDRIKVIHEPHREVDFGAPDFRIESNGAIIGYVETKSIGKNLDEVLKSKQIKRYISIVPNLIVTDYAEFILIANKKIVDRAKLFYLTDLEKRSSKLQDDAIQKTSGLFNKFFFAEPVKIKDAKELAVHLADRGKILKEFILEIVKDSSGDSFSARIADLYTGLKATLVDDLSIEEFADAYAQTVVYGFFLAFLQSGKQITAEDAARLIPQSFKIIREFFAFINDQSIEKPVKVEWIFNEIINLINNVDQAVIYESLSFKKRAEFKDKDPYLYFYETFLGEFDPKKRKSKGVYYTPLPVVSFITRSIDILLRGKFGKDGFADPSVTVLDFATGTGTFLVAIFELIFESIGNKDGRFNKLVREHLLKNFYGFEYLIAPYVVAHLKLSQLLKDSGYVLQEGERLQVYLTDTLDNIAHKGMPLMNFLTKEGQDAHSIKTEEPILVVTGNPPYNNKSRNNKEWIRGQIQIYKPRDESKLNLDDDYIKFIRYAHWKVKTKGHGIIGIITNNSFLNGLTHRKMRGELLKDFDEIYILNLHGNYRIGETALDGSPDDNVFDIQQGVSINIFVSYGKELGSCKVFYGDLYGERDGKYNYLLNSDLKTVEWELIDYQGLTDEFRKTRWGKRFTDDLCFFIPRRGFTTIEQYGNYWGITEIFKVCSSGVKTERDRITIHFTRRGVEKVVQDFLNLSESAIKTQYNTYDSRDWKVSKAKQDLEKHRDIDCYTQIQFRPLDIQWTYYTGKSKGFIGTPGYKMNHQFLNHDNIGLVFMRQVVLNSSYSHFFISNLLTDLKLLRSSEGTDSIAPLYLYEQLFNQGFTKQPNFTSSFQSFINNQYSFIPTPEQILGYIYAVFYSVTYRSKYDEFLRIDFPRIPFTDNEETFNQLAELGGELIEHHLMKRNYPLSTITYSIEGTDTIEAIRFDKDKVYINKEQYFGNVPLDVWQFEIGGYQVLETWLKYRKSMVLSYKDQETFIKICNILSFTISQMDKIEVVARPVAER